MFKSFSMLSHSMLIINKYIYIFNCDIFDKDSSNCDTLRCVVDLY